MPPPGRFVYRTGEDERLFAETEDGWRLAMSRYRPRGAPRPYPVVAGHGLAGSRLIYDLGREVSLARFLSSSGFDVYTVDLRGRGASWPPRRRRASLQWSFDDIAERDFPAAIARACEVSGAPEAFWLGMEMSGQALYAAAILGRAARVRGAVTFGAPVRTPSHAQVPGVTAPLLEPQAGRIPLGIGARAAGPLLAYAKSELLESSFRPSNSDPLVVSRYFVRGVPDESTVVVDQFASWVREGVMRNLDGSVVYSDRLAEVRLPLLVMVGAADLQRPPEAVRAAFEAFGSADKTFVHAGEVAGFSVDFGHDDLLAGVAAPAEIFPVVRDWLVERSTS